LLVVISLLLTTIQTVVLLNLAWILNDERLMDIKDLRENYLVETLTNATQTIPAHKHIISQDDRFCIQPQNGNQSPEDPLLYVYYKCLFENSMTVWDIFTLILLCIALYEKLSDSHLEFVYQMVLGTSGIQASRTSIGRRTAVLLMLSLRCLQEALFVSVSLIIVSAAKGTLIMILNSLAISFFADLDNQTWERLLMLFPSLDYIKAMVTSSLSVEDREVIDRVEDGKLWTMRFSLYVTMIYACGTVALKNPALYLSLDDTAAPDTNISASLFIVPITLMWALLVVHSATMSADVVRWKSVVLHSPGIASVPRKDAPGSLSATISVHIVTLALCLLFGSIGIVEGVIGAHCSLRFSMYYFLILSLPTLFAHALLHARLKWFRLSRCAAVMSVASVILSAAVFVLAMFLTLAPNKSSYTIRGSPYDGAQFSCEDSGGARNLKCLLDEALMGGHTSFRDFCLCGYTGWTPYKEVLDATSAYCSKHDKLPTWYTELASTDS